MAAEDDCEKTTKQSAMRAKKQIERWLRVIDMDPHQYIKDLRGEHAKFDRAIKTLEARLST